MNEGFTMLTGAILYLIGGLCLLLGGAETLVRGSVGFARKLNISTLIVGLTVVAFGTSAPELVVSLNAALKGSAGISVGNVVGSNIANIALVLAVTAILWPVGCNKSDFKRDYGFLFAATAIYVVFCMLGQIERWQGATMVALLFGYIYYNFQRSKKLKQVPDAALDTEELDSFKNKSWIFIIVMVLIGLFGVIYGAELLVKGSVEIARAFGVSEEIIGLTLIAIGTSLPELATSVVAALRKENDMALGNVVGSNIWNILFIMGTTATVIPVPVPLQVMRFDLWIMAAITLILFPLMYTKSKLSRGEGVFLLLIYVSYMYSQYFISTHNGQIPFLD